MKARTLTLVILLACSGFAIGQGLEPVEEYEITPEDYGMDYSEVVIPVEKEDYTKLNGWFFKPHESGSKKIIIMSSDGQGNMADDLELVGQFISLGYHVLIYDYRGYGKSSDFKISSKFYLRAEFADDLQAVIDYVKKYHAKLTTLDLYGHGIGAGLALGAGANNGSVRRVIADAPYVKLEDIRKRYKEQEDKTLLMPIGYDKNVVEPYFALQEKGRHLHGILVIVGESDPIITPDDIKEMNKVSQRKIAIYEVEEAKNEENFTKDRNAYFSAVKNFLQKN